jgi:hypothetical protein
MVVNARKKCAGLLLLSTRTTKDLVRQIPRWTDTRSQESVTQSATSFEDLRNNLPANKGSHVDVHHLRKDHNKLSVVYAGLNHRSSRNPSTAIHQVLQRIRSVYLRSSHPSRNRSTEGNMPSPVTKCPKSFQHPARLGHAVLVPESCRRMMVLSN